MKHRIPTATLILVLGTAGCQAHLPSLAGRNSESKSKMSSQAGLYSLTTSSRVDTALALTQDASSNAAIIYATETQVLNAIETANAAVIQAAAAETRASDALSKALAVEAQLQEAYNKAVASGSAADAALATANLAHAAVLTAEGKAAAAEAKANTAAAQAALSEAKSQQAFDLAVIAGNEAALAKAAAALADSKGASAAAAAAAADVKASTAAQSAQQALGTANAASTASNTALSRANAVAASAPFSVRDYGAKGDGITDDTAAVQAACNAAQAVGGVVFFPPGKFICGAVTLGNNLHLQGAPSGTTIVAKDMGTPWTSDAAYQLFHLATSVATIANLTISNLRFQRPGANCARWAFFFPTGLSSTSHHSNIRIEDCYFDKIGGLYAPQTNGLWVEGNIANGLWVDHTYNEGFQNPGIEALNIITWVIANGSQDVTFSRNELINIWSGLYLDVGLGAGNSFSSNITIADNHVRQTASSVFMVRATAGTGTNVVMTGNNVIDAGKTPFKMEINNNSGGNQAVNINISNNNVQDWGRFAGGECVQITGSSGTAGAILPASINGLVANNNVNALNYPLSGSFVMASNYNGLKIADNNVSGARLATANYVNSLQISGNYALLRPGTEAIKTYGAHGFLYHGNTIIGEYNGPIGGLFDDTRDSIVTGNFFENRLNNLTSPNYILRFNNTGSIGAATNSQSGLISQNFIRIPNSTYNDALGTTAKPFLFPDTYFTTFALTNNVLRDASGFEFQGAAIGNISNLGYYYSMPGTMKANPDFTNLLVNDGTGSGSGSSGVAPLEVKAKVLTTATYTMGNTDFLIFCNPTSSSVAITGPAAPVMGVPYRIKDLAGIAGSSPITFTPAFGKIDGATSKVINTNGGSLGLIYTGIAGKEWTAI